MGISGVLSILALGLTLGLVFGLRSSSSSETVTVRLTKPTKPPQRQEWISEPCMDQNFKPTCPWKSDVYFPVLLISLDGFRADYLLRNLTPTIKKLRDCGVHTPYMRSVYPTLTFPNHYTIVTGLYPESHGIVDNNMYDEEINEVFSLGGKSKFNPKWWGGEPIWLTAQRQNKKAASFFWVGSDVNISGYPDEYRVYDGSVPYPERIDTVLNWLSLPEDTRPDIITLYFDEPDHAGHGFGPVSSEVDKKLVEMDGLIRRLMDGLYEKKLHNCVNIMIIADHGMESVSCDREFLLDCYVDVSKLLIYDGTIGRISTEFHTEKSRYDVHRNVPAQSVTEIADSLQCRSTHYKSFTKDDLPKRFHYLNNKRIGEVIVDVEDKWLVFGKGHRYCLKGNHGYDNTAKSMQALFLAHGPGFRQNIEIEPFENIELYNVMCELMGISASPNNGTFGSLDHILRYPPIQVTTKNVTNYSSCTSAVGNWSNLPVCTCQDNKNVENVVQALIAKSGEEDPIGQPVLDIPDEACVLSQQHYTAGFSHTLHMPMWAALTLSPNQVGGGFGLVNNACVVPDARLKRTEERNIHEKFEDASQNITRGNLLPENLLSGDCGNLSLSTSLVPMYQAFREGIWKFVWNLVADYVKTYKKLHITTGPIFDHNHDGLWEGVTNITQFIDPDKAVPMPTHFYVILVKCKSNGGALPCDNPGNLDTLTFILPHKQRVPNCLDYLSYLKDNTARIRDVELLTGLKFLDKFPFLQTVRIRVHLSVNLWQTNLPMEREADRTQNAPKDWMDWKCKSEGDSCGMDYKPVLLVSLDGFRAEYLLKNVTPVIAKLMEHGVHAPYMRSVYPTLTFPNHYTIATGLYPESHGIIDNDFNDMSLDMYFTSFYAPIANDPRWWGGEPIWRTVQKFQKKSGTFFWPGNAVMHEGRVPDYLVKYNKSIGFNEQADRVLEWLTLPADQRPEFIALYVNEPDHAGHSGGPDSSQVEAALEKVDKWVGYLMNSLYKKKLHNCVNIMMLADHGMSPRSCDRVVSVQETFSKSEVYNDMYVYTGMNGRISNKYFKQGKKYIQLDPPHYTEAQIMQRLTCSNPHLRSYLKKDFPKRHHYINNDRIDGIILEVDDEWVISRLANPTSGCSGGSHGLDNLYKSMEALFLSHGPAFKQDLQIDAFENIEIYNLICDVLGITGAPNNGTLGNLHVVLKNPPTEKANACADKCEYPKCESDEKIKDHIQQQCNCSAKEQTHVTESDKPPVYIDLPQVMSSRSVCLHQYKTLSSGQEDMIPVPLWTAITLTQNETSLDGMLTGPGCVVLYKNSTYYKWYENSAEGITTGSLYTDSDDCGPVTLSIAAAPMYKTFRDGIWHFSWTLIQSYLKKYGKLQVTAGPIWDYNNDGLFEAVFSSDTKYVNDNKVPFPTHYFLIVSKCKNSSSEFPCDGKVDMLPFILPHLKELPTCETKIHYLKNNVARLRDIELLTNLRFFVNHSTSFSAPLRTFLPMELWTYNIPKPTGPTGKWMDQPCPVPDSQKCPSDYQPLLLISLDGFRADYLVKYNKTPVIEKLSRCGVHAPYMRSVYPTKTFPNHYTIVTGLYPESHGIIDNNMYDMKLGQKFSLKSDNKFNRKWWGGEPIWLTAENQGKKSATMMWPGSDVSITGKYATYFRKYNGGMSYESRANTILFWLSLPEDRRPDFLTLYIDEPDHTGHSFGPNSTEIAEKLKEVDSVLEKLMDELYEKNLHNCINIMIVADHGMSSKSCDRMVSLQTHLTKSETRQMYIYDGPFGRISNVYKYGNSSTNTVLNPPIIAEETILNRLQCVSPHLRVYDKKQLPKRHHYANNKRIDDIILDVDDEWLVSRTGRKTNYCKGGDHGYDNLYSSMAALFLAHGPAFKESLEVKPFENIELYNLMTEIVKVKAAPNNGTVGTLNQLLKQPSNLTQDLAPGYRNCSTLNGSDSIVTSVKQQCNCSIQTNSTTQPPVLPAMGDVGSVCSLSYQGGTIGYSQSLHMPHWIAFTLDQSQVNQTIVDNDLLCVVPDPNLPSAEQDTYKTFHEVGKGIVTGSLLRGGWGGCPQAIPSSLAVPLYEEFRTGIWNFVWKLVKEYTETFGQISVTVGPVFDYNYDGLYEGIINKTRFVNDSRTVPIPTHYFMVLAKCKDSGKVWPCGGKIDLLSFIIPHVETILNCLHAADYLRENVARVRDIELLTGLGFFTQFSVEQTAQLQTFLPTSLWPAKLLQGAKPKPGHWADQPCPAQGKTQCQSDYSPLLLISLDGFRADYLKRNFTPTLQRLSQCGVHAPYMRPVYPSKTFPNHYSIVTGLYPESHGIIDNNMVDMDLGLKFRIGSSTSKDSRWWGGDPIWLTAKRQGNKTAAFFWVGSDIKISGQYPDRYRDYSGSVTYEERIDTVLGWMSLPHDQRPDLITLYFDEPDHTGHADGPDSPEENDALKTMDLIIKQLMDGLYQRDLHHCVNLIIVADHGMADISCDQVVTLSDYFTSSDLKTFYVYEGAFGRISNKYKYRSRDAVTMVTSPKFTVPEIVDTLQCNNSHLNVYLKTELPKRHHFANNIRIDDIILDVPSNWTVARKINQKYCSGGNHGYDNTYWTMGALFMAHGPAFKNEVKTDAFENIELYNLMAEVLGIEPSPNNGTLGSLHHILQAPPLLTRQPMEGSYQDGNVVNISQFQSNSQLCGCNLTNSQLENITNSLNSARTQNATQEELHLPFGQPYVRRNTSSDIFILHQSSHVTLYRKTLHLPVWVSYTLSSAQIQMSSVENTQCTLTDPRVNSGGDNSFNCSQLSGVANVSYNPLIPTDLTPTDESVYLHTSQTPMMDGFESGIWSQLNTLLLNWTNTYSQLNIITGPVFDFDSDGLPDSLEKIQNFSNDTYIPTDFFIIITRCENSTQSLGNCTSLKAIAFILPHKENFFIGCQSSWDYIVDNEARIRDVELITGLEFYTGLPPDRAVLIRTYLPHGLWNLQPSST